MRPAFRRGWVWGGKSGIVALARASGRSPPHGGRLLPLWEREGETLGVPANQMNGGGQPPSAATRHKDGTLATAQRRRTPCARACGLAGVRQGERQECQRVSAKMPRPQERKARDRARPQPFPLILSPLLIVTRMGRNYRPGQRQRTEQVARRVASLGLTALQNDPRAKISVKLIRI
jgi:hypothetical protein